MIATAARDILTGDTGDITTNPAFTANNQCGFMPMSAGNVDIETTDGNRIYAAVALGMVYPIAVRRIRWDLTTVTGITVLGGKRP